MRFSIVVVTYNAERFLERTLLSIFEQSFNDFEVVVKDGCSKDKTHEILDKFKSRNNIKIHIEPDQSLSEAMNQAISYCSGQYVLFLHADDLFSSKESLELLDKRIEKSDPSWGFGFYKYADVDGVIFKADDLDSKIDFLSMIARNIVRHQAAFVKRDCFSSIGFSNELTHAMDYLFFLNIWTKFGPPLVVKEYVSIFTISGFNLSSDYYSSIRDELKARWMWRKSVSSNVFWYLFDSLVYVARIFKLRFIHGKKTR
jgi:glycosyltransferase involved in cell wall biosynthesis